MPLLHAPAAAAAAVFFSPVCAHTLSPERHTVTVFVHAHETLSFSSVLTAGALSQHGAGCLGK